MKMRNQSLMAESPWMTIQENLGPVAGSREEEERVGMEGRDICFS